MRIWAVFLALSCLALASTPAFAASNYVVGTISQISFETNNAGGPDGVLMSLSAGLPSNCTGATFGWMYVPASSTVVVAYVTGLWLSGSASLTTLTVYTSGLGTDNFCEITQIQPSN